MTLEETTMRRIARLAKASDRAQGAFHAGRLLWRRDRGQHGHDAAGDPDACPAPRSTAPIARALPTRRKSWPPAIRTRATGRSTRMSSAAGRAARRCRSRHATATASRCRAEIPGPLRAADRPARRSAGGPRRSRDRHLSRKRRGNRAGSMGPGARRSLRQDSGCSCRRTASC